MTKTRLLIPWLALTGLLLASCVDATPKPAAPIPVAAATLMPTAVAPPTIDTMGGMHSMSTGDMDGKVGQSDFDAKFIDSMIMHHQGAINMATEALTQAQHPELRALAAGMIKSQQDEIDQMLTWRNAWFAGVANTGGLAMSMGEMSVAPGDEIYDLRFIGAMIPHHEGAMAMAQAALTRSKRPDLLKLASDIIGAQSREIKQMDAWRAVWAAAKPDPNAESLIEAEPQMVMGNRIMITRIKIAEAGWVVIHANTDGVAGTVLGSAPVKAGETKLLQIRLKQDAMPSMIAMLYFDKGKKGILELDGPDAPVTVYGKPVSAQFDAMIH